MDHITKNFTNLDCGMVECDCGEVGTSEHVLFDCLRYECVGELRRNLAGLTVNEIVVMYLFRRRNIIIMYI